jgi:hypothetical protein
MFLQRHMYRLLGPVLILVALLMPGIFKVTAGSSIISEQTQKRLAKAGPAGALCLGMFFALSFCPVSAALFFGSTAAIAVRHGSRFVMPALYGIGTAAPVVAVAVVVAFSAHSIGVLFNKISAFEKWARTASAIIILIVGIYLLLRHTFGLF